MYSQLYLGLNGKKENLKKLVEKDWYFAVRNLMYHFRLLNAWWLQEITLFSLRLLTLTGKVDQYYLNCSLKNNFPSIKRKEEELLEARNPQLKSTFLPLLSIIMNTDILKIKRR